MVKSDKKNIEARRYLRIPTVIPIEFSIVDKNKNPVWKTVYQGYTRNLNQGGVCIEVYNFDDSLADRLIDSDYLLFLHIDLPNHEEPISAYADPRWLSKIREQFPNRYNIGVAFTDIGESDVKKIVGYAAKLRRRPKQIAAVIGIFALFAFSTLIYDVKLRYDNVRLVKEINRVKEQKQKIDTELQRIEVLKSSLEQNLEHATTEIDDLTEQLSEVADEKLGKYQLKIQDLRKNKDKLALELKKLVSKEASLTVKMKHLQTSTTKLDKKNTERMYGWIKGTQNSHTGLVPSFEGDSSLTNFSFTYDQALVIENFILRENLAGAKKTIDFFKYRARRYQNGFLNAYDAANGRVMEWTAHVGPNAWLGMAVLKYVERTGATSYLSFATEIADWILRFKDKTGGIRGGPTVSWYSTEHAMDCYAFFRMLHTITKNPVYLDEAESVLKWIKRFVYIDSEGRFKRGKNDDVIATDTVSFGVPAIGPKKLYEEGMNPERLIKFIEEKTIVTTKFKNNKGKEFKIVGFDYTDPVSIGRPGIVSSEWTAQMVTTYNVMADYFESKDKKKSTYYKNKANYYLSQLDRMMIIRPYTTSRGGGLPYATGAASDTGHGWLTPKSPFAISVAGTGYTLLARNDTNPFCLEVEKKKYK